MNSSSIRDFCHGVYTFNISGCYRQLLKINNHDSFMAIYGSWPTQVFSFCLPDETTKTHFIVLNQKKMHFCVNKSVCFFLKNCFNYYQT